MVLETRTTKPKLETGATGTGDWNHKNNETADTRDCCWSHKRQILVVEPRTTGDTGATTDTGTTNKRYWSHKYWSHKRQ